LKRLQTSPLSTADPDSILLEMMEEAVRYLQSRPKLLEKLANDIPITAEDKKRDLEIFGSRYPANALEIAIEYVTLM
jgi:hypothetical protein